MQGICSAALILFLLGSPLTQSHDLFTKAFQVALKHGGETREAGEAARAVLHKATRDPALLHLVGMRGCERAAVHRHGHSADDSQRFFGAQAVAVSAVQEIAGLRTKKASRELAAALDLCLCQHYPDVVKQAVRDHGPALLPYLKKRKKEFFAPARPGELRRCSADGVDFYIRLLEKPATGEKEAEPTPSAHPAPGEKP